jgi:excisionase family DNA binding protein
MRVDHAAGRATMTVEAAAKILGIGRNQAYAAAARGELPVIRIGKRLLVPITALERLVRGDNTKATSRCFKKLGPWLKGPL